jgi:ATP synthase protein I
MSENKPGERLAKKIERKERRKIHARKTKDRILWFGLGTFGLIGWSVMIPTIIGLVIGIWIDQTVKTQFSWTVMLLMAGIIVGCVMAWVWVNKERRSIERDRKNNDKQ